eukprot:223130_1
MSTNVDIDEYNKLKAQLQAEQERDTKTKQMLVRTVASLKVSVNHLKQIKSRENEKDLMIKQLQQKLQTYEYNNTSNEMKTEPTNTTPKIKIILGKNIRLWDEDTAQNPKLLSLKTFVSNAFHLDKNMTLQYIDEENDQVQILSNEDITDAIETAQQRKESCKIYVTPVAIISTPPPITS